MTRFGKHPDRTGRDLVEEALAAALKDAEVEPGHVQAAFVGNASAGVMTGQESVRAQTVLRRTGLMGIPMMTVENACASSSTALHLGWQAIAGGMHDCVVVVGYEKLHHEDRARTGRALRAFSDLEEATDILGAGGRQRLLDQLPSRPVGMLAEPGHRRSSYPDLPHVYLRSLSPFAAARRAGGGSMVGVWTGPDRQTVG